jgi:hypothetical protein
VSDRKTERVLDAAIWVLSWILLIVLASLWIAYAIGLTHPRHGLVRLLLDVGGVEMDNRKTGARETAGRKPARFIDTDRAKRIRP